MQTSSKIALEFLGRISRPGFYWILAYVEEKGEAHYNEILKAAQSSKVVSSSSQINKIVHTLTDYGLLQRKVTTDRPIRTTYAIDKKGKNVLHYIKQIESEIE